MLRSSLFDYSDVYALVSGAITVAALVVGRGNNNIQVVFKNCALFVNCITKLNNTQLVNSKGINVVMPMYNLIEFSGSYSKTSGGLWQYYRDEQALTDIATLDVFPDNSVLFKLKQKITGSSENDGTKAL